jgi:DNA-binding CsgD family transcriptional regulator
VSIADGQLSAPLADLSRRESEVLAMVSMGLTNAEVARRLEVTVHAIKFHLASIYKKLNAANRTEAVVIFLTRQADSNEEAK